MIIFCADMFYILLLSFLMLEGDKLLMYSHMLSYFLQT